MKLTADRMCITSGRLCKSCQRKYDRGDISDIDITVGQVLLNVAKSQRSLSEITVKKLIETVNTVYVVVEDGDLEKLSRAGEHLEKKLREKRDKKFIYLEKTRNTKELVNSLLDPISPVATSTVMLPPDGEKELKVKIKKSDKDKLGIDSIELSRLTKALLNMNAHYSYV